MAAFLRAFLFLAEFFAIALDERRVGDAELLFGEIFGLHDDELFRGDVENFELRAGHDVFAGERVGISFESGAWIGERVNDPEIGDFAIVVADDGEFF